jgi:hypothetical protein
VNTLQAARQLQFLLQSQRWTFPYTQGLSSSPTPVFANVYVSQGPAEDIAPSSVRYPFAIVKVMDASTDDQENRFFTQRFEVTTVVQNSGDQFGEGAMVGSHRVGPTRSPGRGLLEIEEQVLFALRAPDPADNQINQAPSTTSSPRNTDTFKPQLLSMNAAEGIYLPDVGYIVARSMTFQTRVSTIRSYPAPNGGKKLTATATGGGNSSIRWFWKERYDLRAARGNNSALASARGALVLIRKAGATPPATVSDGTLVTFVLGNVTNSVTDSPGAGTWSYSLFAQYDVYGDGTGTQPMTGSDIQTSTAATASGIVVT